MASDIIRTCIDRTSSTQTIAPKSTVGHNIASRLTNILASGQPAAVQPAPQELALQANAKWEAGSTLRIRFLDGSQTIQERVKETIPQWSRYGNIHLSFGDDPGAEIRVSFNADSGSWSYIGKDCLTVASDQPTINFGWLTENSPDDELQRVVLHEFGHALGCIHEHQSPSAGIPWNKSAVYRYYAGAPNFWSREQVDINIFQRYSKSETQFSAFDSASIMMYPIPKELTTGGYEVGWNMELSRTDKRFIADQYPFSDAPVTDLVMNTKSLSAEIGKAGETDVYRIFIEDSGIYTIETLGKTDVVMSLYTPTNSTTPFAQDDDSGRDTNAKITAWFSPGAYYIRLRHYYPVGKGQYSIRFRSGS